MIACGSACDTVVERSTCHMNSMLITVVGECATDKTCDSVIVRAGSVMVVRVRAAHDEDCTA